MTKLAPRTRLDLWDQDRPWVLALGGVAYGLLAVLAGLTLPWRTASTASLAIDISLVRGLRAVGPVHVLAAPRLAAAHAAGWESSSPDCWY